MDIIIVTWNQLSHLKCQIDSIRNNSTLEHKIYIHVNCGNDGTKEYLEEENIPFTYSEENIGLPKGANAAAAMGSSDTIYLVDDDIYFAPKWDKEYNAFVQYYGLKESLLCPLMVEPIGNNPLTIAPCNFGQHPINFKEKEFKAKLDLLMTLKEPQYTDVGPFFISRGLFDRIGGYSEEFSPAIGSDNDLVKKVWDTGYHDIVTIPRCIMYHFQSVSTNRIDRQLSAKNRDIQFEKKFGMSIKEFARNHLLKGNTWERVT